VVWGKLSSPSWALSQDGGSEKIRRGGGQEEKAEQIMVSTISFIQANLQHNIAASSILTGTVGKELTWH
jgi:hypothetical protein